MYYGTRYKSTIGDILLASDENNIIGLWIGKQKHIEKTMAQDIIEKDDIPVLQAGIAWLDDYFAGKKPELSRLPLAPIGGEFKQQVWKILTEIPYGELTTYGNIAKEVAIRMGKDRMSAQAVGGAVGHNPISIIIPCHRVVGSNGSLTGYGGGIDKKVRLLEHEGADMTGLLVPAKLRNLDSIIFDLDGTLWDSTQEVLVSWNQVLDKYDEVGKKFTKEDIEGFMGTPITTIFEVFLPHLDAEKRTAIEKECSENEMKYIATHGGRLFHGLEDVLKVLSAKYKLAIVSNCQNGYIEAFLKYYGFEKYIIDFEHIGRTGLPKGENIKLVMERNKLKNSIYVGDTDGDRKAARLAGVPFVYARYGFGEVKEYDYVIDTIEKLLEMV